MRTDGAEPFPWLLITVWVAVAAPIVLTVFAVVLGVHYCPWWR